MKYNKIINLRLKLNFFMNYFILLKNNYYFNIKLINFFIISQI